LKGAAGAATIWPHVPTACRSIAALVLAALLLPGVRPVFADPAPASAAAAVILDSLVVRIYDNAGVSTGDRSRAMERAGGILDLAGVDVAWLDCPARRFGKPAAGCKVAPSRRELVIRLVDAPTSDGATRQALGYSLIDSATGMGVMATVFVDRVSRLANDTRADRATILGRALAHEIGHLILASHAHADSGIMRETWTAQELISRRAEDWLFLPTQGEQLRQARLLQGTGNTTATQRVPADALDLPPQHRVDEQVRHAEVPGLTEP
jgi:hypothetical protein